MKPPVDIEWFGLVRAGVLVALAAGVSFGLRLDLERRMLWAALRATVQLFCSAKSWLFCSIMNGRLQRSWP